MMAHHSQHNRPIIILFILVSLISYQFEAQAADKSKKIPAPIIRTDNYLAAGPTVRAAYLAGLIDGLSLYTNLKPGPIIAKDIRACLDGQSISNVAENINDRLVHAPSTSGQSPAASSLIKELAAYCGLDFKP